MLFSVHDFNQSYKNTTYLCIAEIKVDSFCMTNV